jgi:predicted porin
MTGWTAGLEAEYKVGNGSVFGQIGYVEAIGDPGDNEFEGVNVRAGYQNQLAENWRGFLALEFAESNDCFEDCGGDWGRYTAAELGAEYSFENDWKLYSSLRIASIVANTEDTGTDNTLYFGFRKSFGSKPVSSALRTPLGGFYAAGWMEPLD